MPKPGSLFVVGDPKQSIYRFRRADIQIYYKLRDIIVDSGGIEINLITNFRSNKKIVSWVNSVFSSPGFFPEISNKYQAEFSEQIAFNKQEGSIKQIKYENDHKNRAKKLNVLIVEANNIANYIKSLVAKGGFCFQILWLLHSLLQILRFILIFFQKKACLVK